ncbi:MAG: hypothetical protein PT956_06395 [Firmicutes bacterium]|nr:hypothetical protein [Ezakiella sp.]MDD7762258.1 hypothetical protein [Bacillota bacterium]
MRRLLILMMALMLSLSACKKNDKTEYVKNDTTREEANAPEKDEKKNEDKETEVAEASDKAASESSPNLNDYLNSVTEEEKTQVMDALKLFSAKDSKALQELVDETSAEIATEQNLEYSYVIFDDAGELSDFVEIRKQTEEMQGEGVLTMYMGAVNAKNCEMQFSLIYNEQKKLLNYRFYPIQDLEENKKTYSAQIAKAEEIIALLESKDYEAVKNSMSDKIEMSEEEEKQFFDQVGSIVEGSSNRTKLEVVDMLARSTVQAVKDQGVEGKLIDITITGIYETGSPIYYNFVFSETSEMLGLRVIPEQTSTPDMIEAPTEGTEEIKEEEK